MCRLALPSAGVRLMSVRSLDLYHVAVPLKKTIRHASHERATSDNLVVRVTLDDGQTGHGEGVPRSYVTGETIETTFETLSTLDVARHMGHPRDYLEVVRRLETLRIPETDADPRGMAGNAARCALELAILDAYGRRFREPMSRAVALIDAPGLQLRAKPGWVRYSGAIMAESSRREVKAAWLQRIFGFAQVKVKVGVAGQDDPARLARLRRILGRRMDVRLDANEAWPASVVIERVRPLLAARPSALEQPVPHAEVEALAEIRPRLGVPVMLDESLCGLSGCPEFDRSEDGRPVQRPALEVRRGRGDLADRGPGAAFWSGASARLPPGRNRPAVGGGPTRREHRPRFPLCRRLLRPACPGRKRDDSRPVLPPLGLGPPVARAGARDRR